MKRPYNDALMRPRDAEPLFFIKKDTVIGTIGNTQGVSSAAKPHKIASMMSDHNEPLPAASFTALTSAFGAAATVPRVIVISSVVGDRQLPSLQA